ncbi:hypothetical protein TNCV_179521 [Trichonephila clavipes]|nr:hypothetical protein TNCV_179521 [Trichonephila clavipes]
MRSCYLPRLVSCALRCKETLEMFSKVYGVNLAWRDPIYYWHRRFKESRESIEDNEHFGRPSTSRNAANVTLVLEYVRKDCRQSLTQIAEATHFSNTPFERIHLS